MTDKITAKKLIQLYRHQNGRCGLTGRELDLSKMEIDHIVPRADGGKDEMSNVRLVCREANQAKRRLSDADFIALCRDVANHMTAVNHDTAPANPRGDKS